jgi:pimeloyl-ACP methyl ester carboxylesterase
MKIVGQGQPVLLLHSSLSSHKQWLPLVGQLSEKFQLLQPDLLGYGSYPVAEFQAEPKHQLAVEADAVLAQIPVALLQQPMLLIGHSFGGAVALHLARTGKIKLKALILYEPVAFHLLANSADAEAIALTAEVVALSQQMPHLPAWDAARLFVDYWQQQDYFQHLPARMQQQMVSQVWKVPQDFSALIGEPATLADYQQISCPVLLLRGSESRRSALLISEMLERIWPEASVKTLPAGHMGPVAAAELVNAQILEFIRALNYTRHP